MLSAKEIRRNATRRVKDEFCIVSHWNDQTVEMLFGLLHHLKYFLSVSE